MSHSLDLSKLRHDLRTPINHILGYCEMLLEDAEGLPETIMMDLQRIHSGGRNLLELIGRYLNDSSFGSHQDLQQIQHELRTPVNQIIGYSEMLQEQALELGMERLIPDLQRIHLGASHWLALMEEHLIPAAPSAEQGEISSHRPALSFMSPGIAFQTTRAQSADPAMHWRARILVVDDDASNRDLLSRRLHRYGARVETAENGLQALQRLRREPFDLVLLDFLMPALDGYQVLVKLKTDPKLRHLPVIMISGLDQENGIAHCLEAGADDYLTKPFNPVFLRARIGACLEKKHWRDQEQAVFEALKKSQAHLARELAEAGTYVRSLLPPPMEGAIAARWSFLPSAQLGGDAFGYHWLDPERFAIYLLDVCGHGVGAALLSVSVLNVIRAQTLPQTDFADPAAVLNALNGSFPMAEQNEMYFTVWYGIFDAATRKLTYATAGHPPALLFGPGNSVERLRTDAPPIGSFADRVYSSSSVAVPPGATLLVFSDGVYETIELDGRTQSIDDFVAFARGEFEKGELNPDAVLQRAQKLSDQDPLADDFSMMEFRFC
jgi:phosphoserine phosphatase RsbU/P